MRTPISRISAPSPINPVAQPVNAYVRPSEPAPSPLHDLAKGLAAFDSGLQDFMAQRQEKFNEADKVRAEAAFNENNQVGWAEAVRTNKVPANASPVFMRHYKMAQGNLAGIQLREKFNAEYLKWDGKNANYPAAFQTFLGEFVKNNVVDQEDVDVLKGLNPHVAQLYQDGYKVFGADSAKSVYDGSVNTKAAIASRTVDAADQMGLDEGKGTDYEKLWEDLAAQRKEALASGIRKEDYDAQLAATIATKAVELRDPKLLDLLDKTVDGDTVPLKDYPQFRAIKMDAIEKLETIARQQIIDRDKQQTKEDKAKEEAIEGGVARALASNPLEPIPEDVLTAWEKYNPKARSLVAGMRKTFADEQTLEDQRELLLIQRDIADGTVRRPQLMKMVSEGKIKDPKTLSTLLDRVEKFDKSRQEGSGILTDQTTKRFTKAIAERMVGPGEKALADIFGNPVMNDEALQAINDFESALMQWDEKNPEAGFSERQKFINETGNTILQRIDPQLMGTDEGKYTGDTDLARQEAQKTLGNELGAMGNKLDADPSTVEQNVQQSRDARVQQLYQGYQAPVLEELPEANRKYIEEQATKAGMSAEELNMEIWKRTREIIHDATAPKSLAEPSGPQPGMLEKGNIDLKTRPRVQNGDGTISTVRAMSFEQDGTEILVPTVSDDGRILTDDEAIALYHATGKHLGKFSSPDAATAYAEKLHTAQEDYYGQSRNMVDTQQEVLADDVERLNEAIQQPTQSIQDVIGATIDSVVRNEGMNSIPRSSNPEVGALFDLLGRSEGTDKGRGYNETLSYGKFTGGDVELTSMTLGDVKKLQSQMLAHPDNKWNSSALGRYQIVGKTLRALQQQMKLGDDVLFNEETQDAMALQLLKGRGYDKWKAGKMSDTAFLNELAKEWASVPTDKGVGFYGNQKRTPIQPADVLMAFQQVRKGVGTPFDSILTGADPSVKARPAAYAKIPEKEIDQFLQWNPDPEGNSETVVKSVKEPLQKVFKVAQESLAANGIKIVAASGHRDEAQQKKAMEWGWTKTMDSNHRHGDALDVWIIGEDGAIDWDEQKQTLVAEAVKMAAQELGVKVGWGGSWKSFKDRPHFELK